MQRMAWWFVLLSTAPLSGCASHDAPWVELRGRRFLVEVAADDATQARGLMFRDSLAEDRGMLFIFERDEPRAFWMKNTRIPLDILYFDSGRRLVSIAAGVPACTTPQCPSYPSEEPARYTLELVAGMAKQLRAARGDELLIDPEVVSAHQLDPR